VVTKEAYALFIAALAVERCVELWISRRNTAWALRSGAIEYGAEHLVWMKLLHTGFLIGCVAEVWLCDRPFVRWLGVPCLIAAALAQGLRYWTIATLGRRWNVAVVVLSGVPAVASGPFRFMRHPNYLAVIVEGVVVPLVHGAFVTAVVFSGLNAALLAVRIRCEERALREHCSYGQRLGTRPRLWPARDPAP
jgi:methyltransferase